MATVFDYQIVANPKDHVGQLHVFKVRHAASGFECFVYQCRLEKDYDGAPDAYGRNNPSPVDQANNPATAYQRGLSPQEQHLGNATNPFQVFDAGNHDFAYVGVFAAQKGSANGRYSLDLRPVLEARGYMTYPNQTPQLNILKDGEPGFFPVVQDGSSPAPGYYVSTTSALADDTKQEWDQKRYVNANEIPYAAWAAWWHKFGVNKRDVGISIARETGACTGFVFADTGTGHVGEVSAKSINQLTALGGTNENLFNFMVFPNSNRGAADLYKLESAVQKQAKLSLAVLNRIPGNRELLAFIAFDMSQTSFASWLKGPSDVKTVGAALAAETRYATFHKRFYDLYWSLKNMGFQINKNADEPSYPPVGDGVD
jgi:hypothetical protein